MANSGRRHASGGAALLQAAAIALLKAPILLYRYTLSPLIGVNCRHIPSCSEYAQRAIETNGAWKGGWLGLSRLMRCHPWGSSGHDPVPDLAQEHHPWWAPWRYGRWSGRHIETRFGD
jgi:hypothetical protein